MLTLQTSYKLETLLLVAFCVVLFLLLLIMWLKHIWNIYSSTVGFLSDCFLSATWLHHSYSVLQCVLLFYFWPEGHWKTHNLCNGFYKKAFFSSWEKVHKINLFRSFNFFKDGDALLLYELEYSEKYAQTGCILNVRSFYGLVAAPDLNEDSDDEYYILLARDSSLIRKEQAMNRRVWTYLYFLFFYFLFWFLIGIVNIVTDARKSLSVVTLIH